MARPQCQKYREFEALLTAANQDFMHACEQLEGSDLDDRATMQDNVDSCLKDCRTRGAELAAHVQDCEECQSED